MDHHRGPPRMPSSIPRCCPDSVQASGIGPDLEGNGDRSQKDLAVACESWGSRTLCYATRLRRRHCSGPRWTFKSQCLKVPDPDNIAHTLLHMVSCFMSKISMKDQYRPLLVILLKHTCYKSDKTMIDARIQLHLWRSVGMSKVHWCLAI